MSGPHSSIKQRSNHGCLLDVGINTIVSLITLAQTQTRSLLSWVVMSGTVWRRCKVGLQLQAYTSPTVQAYKTGPTTVNVLDQCRRASAWTHAHAAGGICLAHTILTVVADLTTKAIASSPTTGQPLSNKYGHTQACTLHHLSTSSTVKPLTEASNRGLLAPAVCCDLDGQVAYLRQLRHLHALQVDTDDG
eukprot:1153481-Pelagomonas_calceolata.AAC.7